MSRNDNLYEFVALIVAYLVTSENGMNGENIIVVSLFGIASLLAIYRSITEKWNAQQKVGTGIFFLGATIGIFSDEFFPSTSPIPSWAELISSVIIILGFIIFLTSQSS